MTSKSPIDIDTTNDTTNDLDVLDRSRRQMLIAVVATSSVWMVAQIIQSIFNNRLPSPFNAILVIAGIIGALAFMVFMLRFHRFQMKVLADPKLRQRLDDERILELRKEAIYRGWIILIIAIAIGVAVAPFIDLPGQVVLLTLMLIGVNSPIVFFLALDRG